MKFVYRDKTVDIIDWKPGYPWPDRISVDGVEMGVSEWEHNSNKDITIFFKPSDSITRFSVKKSAFAKVLREHESDKAANSFKNLRQSKGFTQQALSFKSGVNIRQIQKIESGEVQVSNITLLNAKKLADALGVTMESFLE